MTRTLLLFTALASSCATTRSASCPDPVQQPSRRGGESRHWFLLNASAGSVLVFWNDYDGGRSFSDEVPAGGLITSSSYDRNTFSVVRVTGECLGLVTLSPALSGHVVLDSGLSVANAETLAKYSEVQDRAYERRMVDAFVLFIARTALSSEPQTEETVALLVKKASAARDLLPARWRPVVQRTQFFIEAHRRAGSEFRGRTRAPRGELDRWLGIEVTHVRAALEVMRGNQPWTVMHELVHQIFLALSPEERAALDQAYTQARDKSDRRGAYALRNSDEFLAERSEAWFGVNDDAPFTAEELRDAEPETAALLERLLGAAPTSAQLTPSACVDPLPRSNSTAPTRIKWINAGKEDVVLWWVPPEGPPKSPTTLRAGATLWLSEREGDVTLLRDQRGQCVGVVRAPATRAVVTLH